jgi:hypothetical protein
MKYDLKKTGCGGVDWIQLRFTALCETVGNTGMKRGFHKRRIISVHAEQLLGF